LYPHCCSSPRHPRCCIPIVVQVPDIPVVVQVPDIPVVDFSDVPDAIHLDPYYLSEEDEEKVMTKRRYGKLKRRQKHEENHPEKYGVIDPYILSLLISERRM
jgi:hypothetical protein